MPPIQLLIKPASGSCNLRCRYCFYEDEMSLRSTANYGIMSLETLEAVVEKSLAYADRSCGFTFQGGEPTLAGLDFFRELMRLEEKHNRKGVQISNAIQTNGFGLDEAWAAFFAENHFLVGVSLDGNKYTHDACRVGPDGGGTFEAVMKTIALFERFSVEYNILTVVNRATAERADKIYSFYAKNHFRYQQYIACLDPMGEPAGGRDYSLTPERYGDFLIRLFDLWYLDLQKGRQPYIRQFENYVALLLGYEPESCEQRGRCSLQYVVEAVGSVYPCDFYVLDRYRMGNFLENTVEELEQRGRESGFVQASLEPDKACRACPYLRLCRGGCRRNREIGPDGALGKNYFCPAYKRFFDVALPRLREIAARLRMDGRHLR